MKPVRNSGTRDRFTGSAHLLFSDYDDDIPSEQLRIALIAPPYFDVPPQAYGGVEAVVADLADGLVALGHDVTLIGAGHNGTTARHRAVWDRIIPERLGEPFPEIMHAILTRREIEELVAAREIDVVHDHTFAGPMNAAGYAAMGLPAVVTVHGPVNADLRRYYRALGGDVALVAISERQRSLAPELNWISTVHNGLAPETWPFETEKEDYALFLGRYHPDKGVHLAVEAAHAAGLPLILAGKCAEPLEQRYFAEEVEPRLGPQDQVVGVADAKYKRELLSRARCLLFPVQWEEPFGMVMIEAMVCGTPVVALRSGAVPEVVVPGVTGLICDTPEELPEAIRKVSALDPEVCRAHVERRFSAKKMSAGYARAYQRAISAQERAKSRKMTV